MFEYEKELEKIMEIIGENNYAFHNFSFGMVGKNQIDSVHFSIIVNCSLNKIKKKTEEIGELTKDRDFAYAVTFFNESELGKSQLPNEKFIVEPDNNMGYVTNKNGKITGMVFSNEFDELEERSGVNLMFDTEDFEDEPFIPYA